MSAAAAAVVTMTVANSASAKIWGGGVHDTAAIAPAAAFPAKGSLSTATDKTLVFAGMLREYLIQSVPGTGRHPVVIVLHGGNSDNKTVWMETSLPTLGARFGFIVVAPNAAMNKHWNDGRGTAGEGKPSTADDVGFLKALIAEVVMRDRGDSGSVFMVGASNGGIMTIRFACEAGHLLRAGSNVISNIPAKQMAACKLVSLCPGSP